MIVAWTVEGRARFAPFGRARPRAAFAVPPPQSVWSPPKPVIGCSQRANNNPGWGSQDARSAAIVRPRVASATPLGPAVHGRCIGPFGASETSDVGGVLDRPEAARVRVSPGSHRTRPLVIGPGAARGGGGPCAAGRARRHTARGLDDPASGAVVEASRSREPPRDRARRAGGAICATAVAVRPGHRGARTGLAGSRVALRPFRAASVPGTTCEPFAGCGAQRAPSGVGTTGRSHPRASARTPNGARGSEKHALSPTGADEGHLDGAHAAVFLAPDEAKYSGGVESVVGGGRRVGAG